MINQKLYLKNGMSFAKGFERLVHGKRGSYVELTREQILLPLLRRFKKDLTNTDYYYYWMFPLGFPDVKIYKQLRTVKYADYKIGYYYVSPDLLLNFKDPEKLF